MSEAISMQPFCTSPVVGGAEKGTADAATSVGFRDEPAFQITDGQPFLAAVGGLIEDLLPGNR